MRKTAICSIEADKCNQVKTIISAINQPKGNKKAIKRWPIIRSP
jgi:hypothetical protein